MAKPNFKNRRDGQSRPIKNTPTQSDENDFVNHKSYSVEPQSKSLEKLRPKYLILCEGETEKAYFDLLKYKILPEMSAIDVEIINPSAGNLKPLVQEAMLKQAQQGKYNKYDAIWIVIDNDECNSYKLDDITLNHLKNEIPETVYEALKANQKYELNVPHYFLKEDDKIRQRFFLSKEDYRGFLEAILKTEAVETEMINTIIAKTQKRIEFEQYYDTNPKALFTDKHGIFQFDGTFDARWKNYVHLAYSCMAFEHWLVLHYERCKTAFNNSSEICSYIREKAYLSNYRKGDYLYETFCKIAEPSPKHPQKQQGYETIYKPFADSIQNNAVIQNNIWLNLQMQTSIRRQMGRIYEVNPYSTIYELVSKFTGISFLFSNQKTTFSRFHDIQLLDRNGNWELYFIYKHKSPIKAKRIQTELLTLYDFEKQVFLNVADKMMINTNEQIIRNEGVIILKWLKSDLPTADNCFLRLKSEDKDEYLILFFDLNKNDS
jgi:RloB-like protein